MLNLPRWQTIVIIAITVLSGLFALPNLLPASVLDHLPHWYQQSRINLGLDLRGGAHFLLEADLRVGADRAPHQPVRLGARRAAQAAGAVQGHHRRAGPRRDRRAARREPSAPRRSRRSAPSIRRSPCRARATRSGSPIPTQDLFRRKKEVIDQSIEILRRRVDETGTIEPTIVRQGDERILLQVPGIKDTTDLKRKINQTAKLTFHLVNEDVAAAGRPCRQRAADHLHGADARGHAGAAAQPIPRPGRRSRRPIRGMTPEQICRRYQPQCLPVLEARGRGRRGS